MQVSPEYNFYARQRTPLKVLNICNNLQLGGAPIVAFEYARYFKEQGDEVITLSTRLGGLTDRYDDEQMEYHQVEETLDSIQSTDDLNRALMKITDQFDVCSFDVVVSSCVSSYWGIELAQMNAISSIWHIHESNVSEFFDQRSPEIQEKIVSSLQHAGRVVFQSEITKAQYLPYALGDNFLVIPGGLPLQKIRDFRANHSKAQLRKKYGIAEDAVVISIIGTTCERKGQHVFLEALKEIEDESSVDGKDVVALIVGGIEGPYLELLKSKLDVLSVSVEIYMESDEIYDFFGLSDIFVCASYIESFPMVLLLALAFELKIVSTDVFGIPEMLTHEVDSLLVSPGNSKALGMAIAKVLTVTEYTDSFVGHGLAKLEKKFNNQRLLPRHRELLNESVIAMRMR